jgi:hypothetical protein
MPVFERESGPLTRAPIVVAMIGLLAVLIQVSQEQHVFTDHPASTAPLLRSPGQ